MSDEKDKKEERQRKLEELRAQSRRHREPERDESALHELGAQRRAQWLARELQRADASLSLGMVTADERTQTIESIDRAFNAYLRGDATRHALLLEIADEADSARPRAGNVILRLDRYQPELSEKLKRNRNALETTIAAFDGRSSKGGKWKALSDLIYAVEGERISEESLRRRSRDVLKKQ